MSPKFRFSFAITVLAALAAALVVASCYKLNPSALPYGIFGSGAIVAQSLLFQFRSGAYDQYARRNASIIQFSTVIGSIGLWQWPQLAVGAMIFTLAVITAGLRNRDRYDLAERLKWIWFNSNKALFIPIGMISMCLFLWDDLLLLVVVAALGIGEYLGAHVSRRYVQHPPLIMRYSFGLWGAILIPVHVLALGNRLSYVGPLSEVLFGGIALLTLTQLAIMLDDFRRNNDVGLATPFYMQTSLGGLGAVLVLLPHVGPHTALLLGLGLGSVDVS